MRRVLARWMSDRHFSILRYRIHQGRWPKVAAPESFSEKVLCRMLAAPDPRIVLCTDKLSVRPYVKERVGDILVPLLGVAANAGSIDFQGLPRRFVLKASHGSGWVRVVMNKSDERETELRALCDQWLSMNYYYRFRERQYRSIEPRILLEEVLLDGDAEPAPDYKLHCFRSGRELEVIIQVVCGRHGGQMRRAFYDSTWGKLPLSIHHHDRVGEFRRPENLTDLLEVARVLSEGFDYVRVDLYSTGDRVYFGELTFTPYAACLDLRPVEWDALLGAKMSTPKASEPLSAASPGSRRAP